MSDLKIFKMQSGNTNEVRRNYSRLVMVGDWIMLANTAGRNPKTKTFGATAREQTLQVFANIEGALATVGASLSDVVRSRVFIPNVAHKEEILGVVAEKFAGIEPVQTITATPLTSPDYLVEIEVDAYRGAGAAAVERMKVDLGAA